MEKVRDDFAVFILSNRRAKNLYTVKMLQKANYSGKWFIVCDNEDETLSEYYELYGHHRVLVFDKLKEQDRTDTGTNAPDRRAVVFARNACFELARIVGVKYFLELDDDYTLLQYRWLRESDHKSAVKETDNMNAICNSMVGFLESCPDCVRAVAFGQGGDLIGGVTNRNYQRKLIRKAMNSFFCSVDRPFRFMGKSNEDVSTYVTLGNRGNVFFTYVPMMTVVKATQSVSGGMAEFYSEGGAGYVKPFSSVIFSPQAIRVGMMGANHKRLHHRINWNSCAPMILHEKHKKGLIK